MTTNDRGRIGLCGLMIYIVIQGAANTYEYFVGV